LQRNIQNNMNERGFYKGKIAWVTGASSGIGEAIARRLAANGADLIISGTNTSRLDGVVEEISSMGARAESIVFDLSDPAEVEDAANRVIEKYPKIDFLFNNGGVSQRTAAIDTTPAIDRRIMEINYFSGVLLTKKVLPAMIKNGGGHIIAISSISGLFGFPLRSAYSASKHAMHGFYESLWTELHGKGIRTTIACPGRVRTNMSLNAIGKGGEPYGKMDRGQLTGISPEKCARQILRAVMQNRRQVLIGGKELILARLKCWLPSVFYRIVIKIKPV
jgi:dehydrogenase/reductase SDR family member 7B